MQQLACMRIKYRASGFPDSGVFVTIKNIRITVRKAVIAPAMLELLNSIVWINITNHMLIHRDKT